MRDERKTRQQLIDELEALRRRVAELEKERYVRRAVQRASSQEEDGEDEEYAPVKVLSGLLPICASCKNIRDDRGYWQSLETYIREHSEADFTHGLCPECMRKLYPVDILKKIERNG